jgi:phage head maturation protease
MDLRFPDAVFRADPGRRLLSGLLVPWDAPARSGERWFVFRPDSLHWSNVSRVKLNRNHQLHDAIGVATELHSTPVGLEGSFRVATGNDGDATLKLAAEGVTDGFSVEVTFEDDDVVTESPTIMAGKRVQVVSRGTLRGVALVAHPAFDDSRVSAIAASRDGRLEIRLDADLEEGVKAAADRSGTSVSELVRGQLRHYVSRRPTYALDGSGGPSLVRDCWVKDHPSEGDAYEASRRIESHRQFLREMGAQFATATRATDPELIPPDELADVDVGGVAGERCGRCHRVLRGSGQERLPHRFNECGVFDAFQVLAGGLSLVEVVGGDGDLQHLRGGPDA